MPRSVAEKPAHLLQSVDNTLRLLQVLRDTGSIRLSDAATELGVAPSTAHRLLRMLVFRGFAVQDEARTYHPGPGITTNAAPDADRHLVHTVRPHLETLATRTGETCHLMVRVGTTTRFLSSVEGDAMVRIGNRAGHILPARLTSGGQVLLAEVEQSTLTALYRSHSARAEGEYLDTESFAEFQRNLAQVRRDGCALNHQLTENGVAALGMPVRDRHGAAIAALSISVPALRTQALASPRSRELLELACRDCSEDLARG